MDELDDVVVPFWVENGEPEPPAAIAHLCLDGALDRDRVDEVRRRWWALAAERLTPLFGPEPPEPFGDDERLAIFDPSGAAALSQVVCTFEILDHDAFAVLSVSAATGADHGRLDEAAEAVRGILRDAAADPIYGEVTTRRPGEAHRTALDVALGRSAERSLASARSALRGYDWVTVCPAGLADRVDRDGGAFAEVTVLPGGALLLRATPAASGWTQEAARAIFGALAPVLPDGQPQDNHGADLSRVVFADAAEVRRAVTGDGPRDVLADLPVGPSLPESGPELVTALSDFVSEAMRQGWLTMEPMDDSVRPEIRDLFPAEMGMGLTPGGQQHLAELLGLHPR